MMEAVCEGCTMLETWQIVDGQLVDMTSTEMTAVFRYSLCLTTSTRVAYSYTHTLPCNVEITVIIKLITRAFSVAGPTVWNSLPDCLRDPAVDSEQFRWDLKTYLFAGRSRR